MGKPDHIRSDSRAIISPFPGPETSFFRSSGDGWEGVRTTFQHPPPFPLPSLPDENGNQPDFLSSFFPPSVSGTINGESIDRAGKRKKKKHLDVYKYCIPYSLFLCNTTNGKKYWHCSPCSVLRKRQAVDENTVVGLLRCRTLCMEGRGQHERMYTSLVWFCIVLVLHVTP